MFFIIGLQLNVTVLRIFMLSYFQRMATTFCNLLQAFATSEKISLTCDRSYSLPLSVIMFINHLYIWPNSSTYHEQAVMAVINMIDMILHGHAEHMYTCRSYITEHLDLVIGKHTTW